MFFLAHGRADLQVTLEPNANSCTLHFTLLNVWDGLYDIPAATCQNINYEVQTYNDILYCLYCCCF